MTKKIGHAQNTNSLQGTENDGLRNHRKPLIFGLMKFLSPA